MNSCKVNFFGAGTQRNEVPMHFGIFLPRGKNLVLASTSKKPFKHVAKDLGKNNSQTVGPDGGVDGGSRMPRASNGPKEFAFRRWPERGRRGLALSTLPRRPQVGRLQAGRSDVDVHPVVRAVVRDRDVREDGRTLVGGDDPLIHPEVQQHRRREHVGAGARVKGDRRHLRTPGDAAVDAHTEGQVLTGVLEHVGHVVLVAGEIGQEGVLAHIAAVHEGVGRAVGAPHHQGQTDVGGGAVRVQAVDKPILIIIEAVVTDLGVDDRIGLAGLICVTDRREGWAGATGTTTGVAATLLAGAVGGAGNDVGLAGLIGVTDRRKGRARATGTTTGVATALLAGAVGGAGDDVGLAGLIGITDRREGRARATGTATGVVTALLAGAVGGAGNDVELAGLVGVTDRHGGRAGAAGTATGVVTALLAGALRNAGVGHGRIGHGGVGGASVERGIRHALLALAVAVLSDPTRARAGRRRLDVEALSAVLGRVAACSHAQAARLFLRPVARGDQAGDGQPAGQPIQFQVLHLHSPSGKPSSPLQLASRVTM